jgi:putative SOS response-associated peptidase YedK
MCGRYTLGKEPNSLLDYFHLHGEVPVYHLSYNIAPSQYAPVILHNAQQQRVCQLMQWGLIPSWSKGPDPRYKMINAKAETVHEKPAYRTAFRQRRCLIPCDGFYEWQVREGGKQPLYIYKQDHGLLALAGLWEHWQTPAQAIDSFTIITTTANAFMQSVHERMPVILTETVFDAWLDAEQRELAPLRDLLKPYAQDDLRMHPVSSAVNSPKQDSPELIQALC